MAPRSTFDLETLKIAVPTIFDQVQSSTATHKKNCVSLHKLQCASSAVMEMVNRDKGSNEIKLVGEKAFLDVFLGMMNRVVVIKKGTPTADRIIKFVGSYVHFIIEKSSGNVDFEDEEETPCSRFISRLLKYLLKGFNAKNKVVRVRCASFVSEIIVHLGELEQELYNDLRTSLLERLLDKEPLVRVHSVVSLSKLAVSEDPDDLETDQLPIITSLLNCLFYDQAAEVRRAALIHLPFTPGTLPALLTRSRDVDPVTRKLLYSSVLTRLAHPKQLTISQREHVVRQGLGDREEAVRLAAAKLLGGWVDLCEGELLQFLQLFDVRAGEICTDALRSIFVTRAEIAQELNFNDDFWAKLEPEGALLARTFVELCIESKDTSKVESCLPVVTALAFLLQNHYNAFLELLREEDAVSNDEDEDEDEVDLREARLADEEFILLELTRLAIHLDYSDEIGRRKMFSVIRQMLAHPELPEILIASCVGVVSVLSLNERDLIRIVVEVINELRDPDPGQGSADGEMVDTDMTRISQSGSGSFRVRKPTEDMSPEEKAQADVIDLRCLKMSIAVLERVNGSFEENSTLEGILADLIIPSVKRKEMLLRENGLISLGLCCLIAKNMAMSSFQLFLSQVKSAPETLRLKVLQVVFDILMTYEKDLLGGAEEIGQRVIAFIMNVLETEESNAVQALICLGLCKLMLFGLVTDERVLTSLVLLYVSPFTVGNQGLRQCLAYFLPVYCYSSRTQQNRMRSIFVPTFDLVNKVYEDLEDDQKMITPLQFGQLLIDWTDPTKAIGLPDEGPDDLATHLDLAMDLVKALYDSERTSEDKKYFCQMLSKLVLPKEVDGEKLYTAYILISNLVEQCPFEEAVTAKAFVRFCQRFEQHFSSLLDGYDEEECFHEEPYRGVFEFVGISRPRHRHFEMQSAKNGPSASEAESEFDNDHGSHRDETKDEESPASAHGSGTDSSASEKEDELPVNSSPTPNRSHPKKRKEKDTVKSKAQPRAGRSKPKKEEFQMESDTDSQSEGIKENVVQTLPRTPMKRNGKRIHTPTKTPSMASPAPKRRSRAAAKTRQQDARSKKDPLENATNKRSKPFALSRPPKQLAGPLPFEDTRNSEDDSDIALQSPTQSRTLNFRQEQIGWNDSSDI